MFQPLHNLVTVVLDPRKATTTGGLILPDTFKDIFITGVVRAVGTGRALENGEKESIPVCPGDRVMIAQHVEQGGGGRRHIVGYPEIVDDGVTCVIVNHTEIIGKIVN